MRNVSLLNERFNFIQFCMEPINADCLRKIKKYLFQMQHLSMIDFNIVIMNTNKTKIWKRLSKVNVDFITVKRRLWNIFFNNQNY